MPKTNPYHDFSRRPAPQGSPADRAVHGEPMLVMTTAAPTMSAVPQPPLAMGVPMGPSVLWPNGVGITDRPQNDESCGSPQFVCCSRPIRYTDGSGAATSEMVKWNYACGGAWHVDNPNVHGVSGLSLQGRTPCCGCTQYVDVTDQGRKVGHVAIYGTHCAFSEHVMAEAFDANGDSKFVRIDHPCHPQHIFVGDRCGWGELSWPIASTAQLPVVWSPNRRPPFVAFMTHRRHCCTSCYPSWVGIRQMPAGASPDDQRLLLAMIHARFWRLGQETQQASALRVSRATFALP